MRSSSVWSILAAALAIAVAASPAIAQQGTANTPPPDAQVGFQRKTQLTPEEQLVEANRHIVRMEAASAGVRKQLEEARRQRDVVKTLCLDDKLSQVNVAIRTGKERKTSLESAVNRKDADGANHEFTILSVLRQRSEQLVTEANQCIGEESAFVGETKVTVTVDPNIAPEEPGYPNESLPPGFAAPPPCASCTL